MGTLAAWYLYQAGHTVTVIHDALAHPISKQLAFCAPPQHHHFQLPVITPRQSPAHISHLIVAVKTPFSRKALSPIRSRLNSDSVVLRFQNGIGSLDDLLPANATALEMVTTSAVKGAHPEHTVVAENQTWIGGSAAPPSWLAGLQPYWPNLVWSADIRRQQWQKLVVNAVINPLTALYDVPNGHIANDPALRTQAQTLTNEADTLLRQLDRRWQQDSFGHVLHVAQATAGNTSSMRADRQRGAPTEIDVINGWLLRQAQKHRIALPAHQAIVDALSAPNT